MKLTILGSGTCGSQMPGIENRQPPAFVVQSATQTVMFDCSEGVRFRLEKAGFDYVKINHICISHSHPDHYAFVHFLQSIGCINSWLGPHNERIDLYAPRQITESFNTLWAMYTPDDPKREKRIWPHLEMHSMTNPDKQERRIGEHKLTSYRVYHGFGNVDACAFRLEADEKVFVYSGDTGECAGIREAAQGADLFLCEASARIHDVENPHKYGHLTPKVAGDIALKAGVKHLVFFHYTGLNTDDEMIANCRESGYEGELTIAKDFQVLAF